MIRILINRLLILTVAALTAGIAGCDKIIDEPTNAVASCEGCHTSYSQLQAVFSPDTTAPAGGCGGEAPHFEPYDRVFMDGEGYEAYKASSHYKVGCTGCHKGVDHTADKEEAHSGNFISHPSMVADITCGSCHSGIVDDFKTSLHQGTGQKRKVAMRSGLAGPDAFDQLPAHQIEGYNQNCATCHGTCGNCHVVRPTAGGGGLMAGHNFIKTPDMQTTCITCHTSRGGHAYLGVAPGTKPDIHLTKMNFTCMDCHTGSELHGNGEHVEHRYAYGELPECQQCHTEVSGSNSFHSMHVGDFNCQVCHSQDYNNCGSCHIHGEGARIPSYLGFKIAANPIPDAKDFDLALVRRTLAAPDNWKEYGVDEYSNFDAFATYNYTTPHNIQLRTTRTNVGEGNKCYNNCHVRNENGILVNKELYLMKEDLLDWEIDATGHITMDDKFPSSWLQ